MTSLFDDHEETGPERPQDPAGSRPRHDPNELRPTGDGPLLGDPAIVDDIVEGEAIDESIEERHEEQLGHALLPEPIPATAAPAVAASHAEPPHAPRFQFLTGALIAIAVAAVVGAGLLVFGGSDSGQRSQASGWSSWEPNGDKTGTQQIADHTGGQYRLPDGHQLVLVEGGPMEVAGLPLTVALRQAPAQGGDIKLFEDKGVLYRLCGLGPNCAIASGKPSRRRHLLLRREALELALYSFRYLDGVKQVVVLMPPGSRPDAEPGAVLPQEPGRQRAEQAARRDAHRPRADREDRDALTRCAARGPDHAADAVHVQPHAGQPGRPRVPRARPVRQRPGVRAEPERVGSGSGTGTSSGAVNGTQSGAATGSSSAAGSAGTGSGSGTGG